jgi:hypothetical protein
MEEQDELLVGQLYSSNPCLAGFLSSIIKAAERLTKGSGKNDFIHCEAVHQRLSELLPNASQSGFNETEIFILCASAYLHDIGKSKSQDGKRHGEISADMITNDDSMQFLFPSGEIQNQIANVCNYHDRDIAQIHELEKAANLDIRPSYGINIRQVNIRPRLLAAIFRLADELECNSDRILGQSDKADEDRSHIAGVRLNLKSRSVCLEFKHGTTEEIKNRCKEYLKRILNELEKFLSSYGFSYEIVEKFSEDDPTNEDGGFDMPSEVLEGIVGTPNSINLPTVNTAYHILVEDLRRTRMNRVDSIISILPKRE